MFIKYLGRRFDRRTQECLNWQVGPHVEWFYVVNRTDYPHIKNYLTTTIKV
jgi:aromatic ring-cleaving dioxygenase